MSLVERKAGLLENELYATDIVGGDNQELRILSNLLLAARRHFWLILILAMLAAAGAFFATSMVEDRFTASSRVKLNTRITTDVQFTPGGPDLPINIASLESELEVMRSSDLIEASIFDLELIERPANPEDEAAQSAFKDELEALISKIRDNRIIEQVGTTSAVFEISVTDTDPFLASALANALGRQYLQRQTLEKIRTLERAQGWLSERTLQIQTQITELLKQQETYIIESPFSPEESATIRAQRQIGERQLANKESDLREIDSSISRIETLSRIGQFVDAAALLPAQSERLEATLIQVASNPSADLLQIVRNEINAGLAVLKDRSATLQQEIISSELTLADLRAKQDIQAIHDGQARQIENEIAVSQAIYLDFVSELSRRTEQTDFLDSDGRIIEFARPPRTPSEPNEVLLSFVTFVGVMTLGLLTALVLEMANRKLRTTLEYEEACGTDLRGVLPDLGRDNNVVAKILSGEASRKFQSLNAFARKLRVCVLAAERHSSSSISSKDRFKPDSKVAPAVGQVLPHRHAKILAGASSVLGEGQSTSLLALAQVLAEAGESVVLVDADFWNSAYSDQFTQKTPGRVINWGNKSFLCDSGTPGLKILPARSGTSRTETRRDLAAFFGSKECDAILSDLATQFDRVIIDTPPLLEVVDSVSLLSHADQVIFFARWKSTKKALVQNAIRLLDDVSIRPTFCVATCVKLGELSRYGDTTLSHLNRSAFPIARRP